MFNKSKKNTEQIKAVHEDDFVGYLKSIGIYNQIESGEKRCIICGEVIMLDNLQIIHPVENEIKLICRKEVCIKKSSELP